MSGLDRAAECIREGGLVVYPTETVYGLGADALDADAIAGVFAAKGRPRTEPISLGLADVEEIDDYAVPTDREREFCERFLPGPVTVLVSKRDVVPAELVAGSERVGVRVPDHDLARRLFRRVGPLTATSANRSGTGSARRIEEIDPAIRERAVVLDGGETPGTESSVVDVAAGELRRRGALADEIEAWLE